ncbi:MAG TPA: imidazoleglycerol-phosphate dehydratase HisB [Oscillospiraceae bacterium]|nr:imidazoleglycerol-phosphate dehydratase HisB [Oscillospiraceae bacterium]
MARRAEISRKTKETDVRVAVDLDGGAVEISTGVGFFDHMLASFALHGGLGLTLKAEGDLCVDAHHTVEDVGIVLGKALSQALGDRAGIERFADCAVPMDEALCCAALDLGGRPYLAFDVPAPQERIGGYDACLTEEFMRAVAMNAALTLHLSCRAGRNGHHITEAAYKAFARAFRKAAAQVSSGVPSTKGTLL